MAATPDAKVTLRLDHVKVIVKGATQKALEAMAFQIEGQAKLNIQQNGQIDTGFMLNSVYTVTPQSSGFGAAEVAAKVHNPAAAMIEAPTVNEGAAIVVSASYAIYQEAKLAFLYPAGEKIAQAAGAICQPIYREALK